MCLVAHLIKKRCSPAPFVNTVQIRPFLRMTSEFYQIHSGLSRYELIFYKSTHNQADTTNGPVVHLCIKAMAFFPLLRFQQFKIRYE